MPWKAGVLLVVLTSTVLGAPACVTGQERRPSPLFSGDRLPVPPEQDKPWTPPAVKLPQPYLEAVTALFDAGFADPRGCEYRSFEIGTGSVWSGDAGIVRVHGWLVPEIIGDKQRFGVCWNGLVYPVYAIGAKADLRADCEAALKDDSARDLGSNLVEGSGVTHLSSHSWLKACLLLRLGEAELVEAIWHPKAPEKEATDKSYVAGRYVIIADEWLWAMFDRAVCAHMRGDHHLAFCDALALQEIQKTVDAQAQKWGFPHPKRDNIELPYFEYLEPLPILLADQARRIKAPKREPLAADADQTARIAALIQDLEKVSARQEDQPGGVDLAGDPIVQKLIAQGEPAVEPLLDCLEKDERLTRSVHFGRDFFPSRSLIGVHEAAYVALSGILRTSFFGVASTGSSLSSGGKEARKNVADSVRNYWNRFKGVPIEERWYLTLADDDLPPGFWMQAAGSIVRRADIAVTPSSMFGTGWVSVPNRKPGEPLPPFQGESLRKKVDPSVAELMAKRVVAFRNIDEGRTSAIFNLGPACQMAIYLAKWDPKSGAPVLSEMFALCSERTLSSSHGNDLESLAGHMTTITKLRHAAGDPAGLKDYAAWIPNLTPTREARPSREMFAPMWENPDHPAIVAAAENLFNRPSSPWLVQFGLAPPTRDLVESPMLGVAGFRARLLAELKNRTVVGEGHPQEDVVRYKLTGISEGGRGTLSWPDPLAPKAGVDVPFRACDFLAWSLSFLGGMPRCELYWPEAERDKAVALCAASLTKYGDRFRYDPEARLADDWPGEVKARMIFPRLDHPATAADVAEVRAIFSLADQGDVRQVKSLPLPLKANWITLKDYPYQRTSYYPNEKKT